jgi:hypothetical protein
LGRESIDESIVWPLAQHIADHTRSDERGVFLNEGNPTVLYLAHRKGWNSWPDDLTAQWLVERAEEGAAFVAGRAIEMPERVLALGTVIKSDDEGVVLVRLD